jgi:hypothetical protein
MLIEIKVVPLINDGYVEATVKRVKIFGISEYKKNNSQSATGYGRMAISP